MSTAESYGACPIKRARRSKAEITTLCDAMIELLRDDNPMTVRQLFYRMVSAGLIDKTEASYQNVVVRLLAQLRRDGALPFSWITDGTRWTRKPRTHSSLSSMLEDSAQLYRRALWDDQPVHVEIWLEKEALAGVLLQETAAWDVSLMVCRGYPSISYLHSTAEDIAATDKPAYLYYFGDHDPSGLDIPRKIIADLREFAPNAEIHFERVAVTMEQVEQWNLTTRPTKKSDSRSRGFEGDSIEVDAIPPKELRQIARNCIEQHVDEDILRRTRIVEEAERDTLRRVSENHHHFASPSYWSMSEGSDDQEGGDA